MQGVIKQGREALHDGQSETEAQTAFARGIAELMIFPEDGLQVLRGNADPGIPNLNAQHSVAAAAAKQYLATLCVFQRVRQEIAKHLFK